MSTIVEVRDQHGGHVRATKDIITGHILVYIYDARNEQEEQFLVDPKDQRIIDWLSQVFQPGHLTILLGD